MIDLHCHILRGVDDGPTDLQSSCEMLKLAAADGIKTIVATPHYFPNITEKIAVRQEELAPHAHNCGITLLTGCEYTLPQAINIGTGLITLADTSYLLIDLNAPYLPPFIEQHLFNLELNKYRVILVHVEKLLGLKHLKPLLALLAHGVIFQINAASILGRHGRGIRQMALTMIESGLCQVVASDAHNTEHRTFHLSAAANEIKSKFSDLAAEQICHVNQELILKNQEPEVTQFKRKSFFSWRS